MKTFLGFMLVLLLSVCGVVSAAELTDGGMAVVSLTSFEPMQSHQAAVNPAPLALLGSGLILLGIYIRSNKYKQH